jgi:hypothetical protein
MSGLRCVPIGAVQDSFMHFNRENASEPDGTIRSRMNPFVAVPMTNLMTTAMHQWESSDAS